MNSKTKLLINILSFDNVEEALNAANLIIMNDTSSEFIDLQKVLFSLIRRKKVNIDTKIIDFLIYYGVDIDERDSDGMTPVMTAAHSGNFNLVKYFIIKGCDKDAKNNDVDLKFYANQGGYFKAGFDFFK